MVRQVLTYSCDVPECGTPPIDVKHNLLFRLPVCSPCAPNGWQYLDQVGLICDRHKVQLTVAPRPRTFTVEPGHE